MSGGALGLSLEPAGDGIAAGVDRHALLLTAAVAILALVDDAVAAKTELGDLKSNRDKSYLFAPDRFDL